MKTAARPNTQRLAQRLLSLAPGQEFVKGIPSNVQFVRGYLIVGRSDVVIGAAFHAQSIIIAALAYQEQGDEEMAARLSGVLHELVLNSRNVYLIGLAQAFEAELALRQGELVRAMVLAEQFDTEVLALWRTKALSAEHTGSRRYSKQRRRYSEFPVRYGEHRECIRTKAHSASASDTAGAGHTRISDTGSHCNGA